MIGHTIEREDSVAVVAMKNFLLVRGGELGGGRLSLGVGYAQYFRATEPPLDEFWLARPILCHLPFVDVVNGDGGEHEGKYVQVVLVDVPSVYLDYVLPTQGLAFDVLQYCHRHICLHAGQFLKSQDLS